MNDKTFSASIGSDFAWQSDILQETQILIMKKHDEAIMKEISGHYEYDLSKLKRLIELPFLSDLIENPFDYVKVKHGHWKPHNNLQLHPDWLTVECSVCGAKSMQYAGGDYGKYCNECGAKMDEEETE